MTERRNYHVYQPEQVQLLRRVLQRACGSLSPKPDDVRRGEIARLLLHFFAEGEQTEERLFALVAQGPGPRGGSPRHEAA